MLSEAEPVFSMVKLALTLAWPNEPAGVFACTSRQHCFGLHAYLRGFIPRQQRGARRLGRRGHVGLHRQGGRQQTHQHEQG